ncbi:MAG: glycoside hydrolase family 1 protein [Deltaproteobacteria bacterium]|nr:glycoside hydrolase family 1 protein [Deltaproteobacteria bacterium]
MEPFALPETFLLGTATASLQIEGGDRNNSWYRWAEQGHITDGTHCIVANDHWNRAKEDTALMKKLNHHTYRMGLEWARIEPIKGKFDAEAMAHYRAEIELLLENNIKPLITLHHFSNPLWLEDQGAWMNPEVIDLFEAYTAHVVENLGDLASDWCTINEPNVYLYEGYVEGIWPPGEKNILKYFKGARNMIQAHIMAYRKIHEIRKRMEQTDTMVGFAHHERVFDPKTGSRLEMLLCRFYERLFHEIFVKGMAEGELLLPVGSGHPRGFGLYMDYFGLNYYTRDLISLSLNPAALFAKMEVRQGAEVNDLGWELYPEGLYRLCKKYYQLYSVPIFITENGTCDARDAFRTRYIYDHLFQISRLIDEGVDVRRFYHWTLMDNFEWVEGLSARFGLVEVDFESQKRAIRPSGKFYAEICENRSVTQKMIEKYLG